jgi:hypothetical protein
MGCSSCLLRRHAVIWGTFICLVAGDAFADSSSEFNSLVSQGKEQLRAGNLSQSVVRFRAAAALQPSPRLLMTVVSLYSDIAGEIEKPGAFCGETKSSLEQFFRDCQSCSALETSRCQLCAYIQRSAADKRLAVRVDELAESLLRKSEALAEEVATRDGPARARATRLRDGFQGKARDVRRCLGRLTLTSNPPGASVWIADQAVALTPDTVLSFAGPTAIAFELRDRPILRKTVQIRAGQNPPVHVSILPGESGGVRSPETAQRTTVVRTIEREDSGWLWPGVSLALGSILVGSGAYILSQTLEKQDELERQFKESKASGQGVTLEQKERFRQDESSNRTKHTWGQGLLITGGAALVGVGAWWYLREPSTVKETTSTEISVKLSLGSVLVSGRF